VPAPVSSSTQDIISADEFFDGIGLSLSALMLIFFCPLQATQVSHQLLHLPLAEMLHCVMFVFSGQRGSAFDIHPRVEGLSGARKT
jgi:hypothetical protein